MTISKTTYRIVRALRHYYYKFIKVPNDYDDMAKRFSKIHIASILTTMKKLLNSNCSLSRFGDGEISWILGVHNKYGFEQNSQLLSKRLLQILNSKNKSLIITLPDGFHLSKMTVSRSAFYWKQYCTRFGEKILPLLNKNRLYYNTSVSRPYIDFNTNKIALKTFKLWKRFWNNKNILIIEGSESRLGVKDSLFNNVNNIMRIECPPKNAFEHYNEILNKAVSFLSYHKDYIAFLSLGPTATVLSYDLCQRGFRSIDIGHIDLEYDWFLMGAKEKVDLPYKYVNEIPNGRYALPISDTNYENEIISRVK